MPLSPLSEKTCRYELENNLLPFWTEKMADIRHGGLLGRMSGNGTVLSGDKLAAIHAAILYVFSSAYLRMGGSSKFTFATQLYEYIVGHFWDEEHGGAVWSLDERGMKKNNDKSLAAQALMLQGLCAYFKVSDDPQALLLAKETFKLIEEHFYDARSGAYTDTLDKELVEVVPPVANPTSLRSDLMLISGFSSLYKTWDDESVLQSAMRLARRTIRLVFDQEETPNFSINEFGQLESHPILVGHQAEASWLLHDAAIAFGSEELSGLTEKYCLYSSQRILRAQERNGSIPDQLPDNARPTSQRSSWTQAQCLVALVNTWMITGDAYYLHRAEKTWEFIQIQLLDNLHGGWYAATSPSGDLNPNLDKVSLEHFGYHSSRAMLELMDRFTIAHPLSL